MFLLVRPRPVRHEGDRRSAWPGERVSRVDEPTDHLVATNVSSADQMECGVWPCLCEKPRHVRRAADIESTMNENSGDARQTHGVPEQLVILEPGGVMEVVRH